MPLMTARERIEAAFSEEGAPEFGVVIPYEELHIRDNWRELTSYPWWHQFEPDLDLQMRWRIDVRTWLDHDWTPLPFFYSFEERESIRIEPSEDGVYRVDRRSTGKTRLEAPCVGGWNTSGKVQSCRPEHPPTTFEEINRLVPNPPADMPLDGRGDLSAAILNDYGKELYPVCQVASPLWACYGLWGFEGLMMNIADRPDLVEHACRRHLAWSTWVVRRAALLGARGIWIEECLTDSIGPEAFGRLNIPHLRQLVEEIRSLGMRSIYYYCGSPAGKWDHILSVGADALSLEESKKGFTNDIDEAVDVIKGRCVLLGNLSSIGTLQNGTEDELRAEVGRHLAAGRRNRGRFIMSLGSPVTPRTPKERVRLYCDLVHEA